MARVLVLAGTTEATELASRLVDDGHDVTSSLAGVTSTPVERPGRVRSGGFGGADGLARYLAERGVEVLIDATHPFAEVMPFNAATAATQVGVPHCRLLRPPWAPGEGDRWVPVPDLGTAATALPVVGARRVLLAVGRQRVAAFAACAGVTFVVRSIEPVGDLLPGAEAVLQRGPFDVDAELALLTAHRIDTIVAKNSGGSATVAKLVAARALARRVVMVDRPPRPDVTTVATVDGAVAWFASVTRG